MQKRLLIGLVLAALVPVGAQAAKIIPGVESSKPNGGENVYIIDAVDFTANKQAGAHRWVIKKSGSLNPGGLQDSDGWDLGQGAFDDKDHSLTACSNSYIEVLPDKYVGHEKREEISDADIKANASSAGVGHAPSQGAIAEYDFDLPAGEGGTYVVWLNMYSTSTEDNAVYVGSKKNGWAKGNIQKEDKTKDAWVDSGGTTVMPSQMCLKNGWMWISHHRHDEIEGPGHCGFPSEMRVKLDAGANTLQIAHRDDGAEVTQIRLTKDLSYQPPGFKGTARPKPSDIKFPGQKLNDQQNHCSGAGSSGGGAPKIATPTTTTTPPPTTTTPTTPTTTQPQTSGKVSLGVEFVPNPIVVTKGASKGTQVTASIIKKGTGVLNNPKLEINLPDGVTFATGTDPRCKGTKKSRTCSMNNIENKRGRFIVMITATKAGVINATANGTVNGVSVKQASGQAQVNLK